MVRLFLCQKSMFYQALRYFEWVTQMSRKQ